MRQGEALYPKGDDVDKYTVEVMLERWAKKQGVAVEVETWAGRFVLVTVTKGGASPGARVVTMVLDLDGAGQYTATQWGNLLGELSRKSGLNSVDASQGIASALDPKAPAGWANNLRGHELRVVRQGEAREGNEGGDDAG